MARLAVAVVVFLTILGLIFGSSRNKPHGHQGVLEPYSGKHIPYTITLEENEKLLSGEAVHFVDRTGKAGRGIVIQDVHAPASVCMDRIQDLPNYHKMVPKVKSVKTYAEEKFANGTVNLGAEFAVGISFMTFGYFLALTSEPRYNTYRWTLDYKFNSDFDDNVGHWQVVPHPTKEGWSRVLYSAEVKLFSWIPEFVVTFLTKTALLESTAWVKKESEKAVAAGASAADFPPLGLPDVSACFLQDSESARYETHCANAEVAATITAAQDTVTETDAVVAQPLATEGEDAKAEL